MQSQPSMALMALALAMLVGAALGARSTDQLKFLYEFGQAECGTGSFADTSGNSFFDVLTASGSAVLPCPQVTNGAAYTFSNAHRGMHGSGTRFSVDASVAAYEWAESSSSSGSFTTLKTDLGSTTDFALDFWIIPELTLTAGGNEYVLLEIGGAAGTAGSNFGWLCGGQYDLRVSYVDDVSPNFRLEYNRGGGGCEDVDFDFALTPGQLYHVVISSDDTAGFPILQLYVDGEPEGNPQISGNSIDFGAFDGGSVLRIGSSPAARSINTAVDTTFSWNGDILMAAFYGKAFHVGAVGPTSATEGVEVDANFLAKLANSNPVPADTNVGFTGVEDTLSAVNIEDGFYDLDTTSFGAAALTYRLEGPASSTTRYGGEFTINSIIVDTSSPVDITGSLLQYQQTVIDQYTGNGEIAPEDVTFSLTAVDASAVRSGAGTFEIFLSESNDLPVAIDLIAQATPQAGTRKLEFFVSDVDCRSDSLDSVASCNLGFEGASDAEITILDVNTPLGKMYVPDSGTGECTRYTEAKEITTTSFTSVIAGEGPVALIMCFEGCLSFNATVGVPDSGSVNECPAGVSSAVLGEVVFEFTVEDSVGAVSTDLGAPAGRVRTNVTNVLSVEEDTFVELTEGDAGVEVTLTGEDNFCILFPTNAACTGSGRDKSFVIGELMDPRVGAIFDNDDRSRPLAEGELLTGNEDKVFFVPAPTYFNRDSYPLCGAEVMVNPAGTSKAAFVKCPLANAAATSFLCVGPDCPAQGVTPSTAYDFYTSEDLQGNLMGDFDEACALGFKEACPARIVYAVKVQQLVSDPAAGVQVFVTNVNTRPTIVLPALILDDVEKTVTTPVRVNGTNIVIEDDDGDTRTLQVILRSDVGQLILSNLTESSLLQLTVGQRSFANVLSLQGTVTEINEALAGLQYTIPVTLTNDFIRIEVLDVSRGYTVRAPSSEALVEDELDSIAELNLAHFAESFLVEAVMEVNFADNTETEDFLLSTITIWATAVGGTIIVCGCCFCVTSAIIRRALVGERMAVWFVKNVLMTHIDEFTGVQGGEDMSDEVHRASKYAMQRIHNEKVNFDRVRLCAHFFVCLCPCCCKLKGDDDGVPNKDQMLIATTKDISNDIAAKHLPGRRNQKPLVITIDQSMLFERHEDIDPDTGAVRTYYFNPHTGESSWVKPIVRNDSSVVLRNDSSILLGQNSRYSDLSSLDDEDDSRPREAPLTTIRTSMRMARRPPTDVDDKI